MPEGHKVRAHVVISGRVQGVWFRASTVEEARRAGVSGWVRNCEDGSVEAVFEGERGAVMQVVGWCYKGPSAARVSNVKVKWQEPTGEFFGFNLRY
jgi:acylphosphatase